MLRIAPAPLGACAPVNVSMQSMLTAASPPINIPPSPAVSSLSSPVTPLSLPDDGHESRPALPLHQFGNYIPQGLGLRT